jgi:hypothetical protein
MPFTVKLVYVKQQRVVRFYADLNITLEELKAKAKVLLNVEDNGDVPALGYLDLEGDYISIGSDEDLKIAIDLYGEGQLLKIFVTFGSRRSMHLPFHICLFCYLKCCDLTFFFFFLVKMYFVGKD